MKKICFTFLLAAGIVSYQPAYSATPCGSDTVRYVHVKATSFLYDVNFNDAGTQIQSVAQWYPAPQSISISAVEFHAFNTSTTRNITFQVDIYAAGVDSLPVGNALATAFVQNISKPLVIDYASTKLVASFNNAIVTAKPYVVVVTTLNSINVNAGIVSNNYKANKPDGKGENLAIISYNNVWSKAANTLVQPGGAGTKVYNLNCDFMIFPVVKYQITAKFGYSPKTTCYDTSTVVSFLDSSSAILNSKFYNQNIFFNTAKKSYSWSFAGKVVQTDSNPSYKFTTYGMEPVVLTDSIIGWTNVCVTTKQVNFAVNTVEVSPNVAICQGNTTSITANGAYTFMWTPATGLDNTNGTTVKANPTKTTTYKVTGSVGNCVKTDSVIVTVNPLPALGISSTSSSGQNGTATVSVIGGTLNYFYQWNTLATTPEITGLMPGKYTVLVTDSKKCAASDSVVVSSVITGISQTVFDGSYAIYPNPTSSQLFVSFAENDVDAVGTITLANMQGITVMSTPYNGSGIQPIQIASLPSGIYTLMFNNETHTLTKKISKID